MGQRAKEEAERQARQREVAEKQAREKEAREREEREKEAREIEEALRKAKAKEAEEKARADAAINEIAQKSREHNRVEAQWINGQEDVDEVGAKQDARAKAPRGFFNGLQPQQSSRQMIEDHDDKPFGMMERLTREKKEAA